MTQNQFIQILKDRITELEGDYSETGRCKDYMQALYILGALIQFKRLLKEMEELL